MVSKGAAVPTAVVYLTLDLRSLAGLYVLLATATFHNLNNRTNRHLVNRKSDIIFATL